MVGQERLAVGVRPGWIEIAEAPGERHQLRIGELLAAEAEHEMLEPGLADRGDGVLRERPGEIDALDFGAESLPELADLNL